MDENKIWETMEFSFYYFLIRMVTDEPHDSIAWWQQRLHIDD